MACVQIMQKTLRLLPSLDFLRGFEAAGRRLSFTLAAEELFLTQSALSRQIRAIEDALGVTLFERRHRALALTAAGRIFHGEVTAELRNLAVAVDALRMQHRPAGLKVSTTVSFASLWLIPRLSTFRARHPQLEVYVAADDRIADLARGEVDVAVRYLADARAPDAAVRLFGERLMPVASPRLLRRSAPLARPADLAHHVLLHLDDPTGVMPWLNWPAWLTANGQAELRPTGAMHFSLYDQVIQAAIAGEGVALGRIPLIARFLHDRSLIAPFAKRYDSPRSYFAIAAPHATQRAEAVAFVAWLRDEARAAPAAPAGKPAARAASRTQLR
jgi:LysR family transcriptional regulator, glycine cleavage system transcriptional activator